MMNGLSVFGMRVVRSVLRWRCGVAMGLTWAALVACGSDVSRSEDYHPNRLLALGDQYSAITDNGRRYSINPADFNCVTNPNWVQSLAGHYRMLFAQCNPQQLPTAGWLLAQPGAKVADIAGQAAQIRAGGLSSTDLVSVFGGVNDVVAAFNDSSLNVQDRMARAGAAGEQLAQVINQLVDAGARVLFVTLPDLGLSPWGRHSGDAAQLSRLSAEFNRALRVKVQQDGRFAAIVLADSLIQAATENPATSFFTNVADAACSVPTPECNANTLVAGADAGSWMWAWGTDFAPSVHTRLAILAIRRAENNPF